MESVRNILNAAAEAGQKPIREKLIKYIVDNDMIVAKVSIQTAVSVVTLNLFIKGKVISARSIQKIKMFLDKTG